MERIGTNDEFRLGGVDVGRRGGGKVGSCEIHLLEIRIDARLRRGGDREGTVGTARSRRIRQGRPAEEKVGKGGGRGRGSEVAIVVPGFRPGLLRPSFLDPPRRQHRPSLRDAPRKVQVQLRLLLPLLVRFLRPVARQVVDLQEHPAPRGHLNLPPLQECDRLVPPDLLPCRRSPHERSQASEIAGRRGG